MDQALQTTSYAHHQPPAVSAGTLSMGQRALYVTGGLFLAAAAAKPRPNHFLSLLALGAGVYLAWRGAQGNCPVKAMIDNNMA
ncbi:hypothetical protein [Roseomonas elaeocarpi]|uniref:DUF2892 domain-containing protein n=1 Tax=Roseomonas elaeocarpi TaxID=907779 RepID=A0ABV6JNV1_9PROT